jgi:uncharacterized protein (TIGR04255 family)
MPAKKNPPRGEGYFAHRSPCARIAVPNRDALLMADNEVFPTPLVKQVAFELRFPNLFFIEGRIGEFQMQVMKDFPQSDLVQRRSFMVLAGDVDSPQAQELARQQASDIEKIWQFKSESGTRVEISSRNLVVVAEKHISYNEGGDKSFRSVVEKVVTQFLGLIQIPVIQRVGVRYINECPLLDKTTKRFKDCYNSVLPVDRFGLENLSTANCIVVAKSGDMQIQHAESLRFATPNGDILVLDLDASAENIASDKVMTTTDKLHEMIAAEFRNVIKEPIVEYMRKGKN